jgi:uroporphyrinogen-III decarboxylase
LAAAKACVGDRLCLAGNVDVLRPLRDGEPAEVAEAADGCLRAAASGGRFMLAPGCEVVADTPSVNLHALVQAVFRQRRYSSP